MNPPGPRVPNHMAVRESVTDGPIPEFEADPQISVEGVGTMAPGDVLFHGNDDLIVTDIDLGDRPADAQLHLFNQRTTVTNVVNAGELAELITSSHPVFHFPDIVIPADATYHVDEVERERGLPTSP